MSSSRVWKPWAKPGGDTSIYFVLRDARRVYAIEPLPENFSEMLENLRLNGINRVDKDAN